MGYEVARTLIAVSLVWFKINPSILLSAIGFKVTIGCLMIAGGESITTALAPAYNSRFFEIGEKEDISWRSKMALKWEFGLEIEDSLNPESLLKEVITAHAEKILETLENVRSKLPSDHAIPYNSDINVYQILQFLEQAREDLTPKEWQEIHPLRDDLARYNTVMVRLQTYLDSDTWVQSPFFKTPFPIQIPPIQEGGMNTKRARIPRPLHIHSLTQEIFKKILTINWLYPSNSEFKEVKDMGSITHSMEDIDPYEERASQIGQHAKSKARFAAQVLTSVAIIAVGAPLGTIYHTVKSLQYGLKYAIANPETKFGNWERIKAHAKAAFDDISSIWGLFLLTIPTDTTGLKAIATRADRFGLFQSITLREKFGITGPGGALLSYNYESDILSPSDQQKNSYFSLLHKRKSSALFYKLSAIYQGLNQDKKNQMDALFKVFIEEGTYDSFPSFLKRNGISTEKIEECTFLFETLMDLYQIIEKEFRVRESILGEGFLKRCMEGMPLPSFTPTYYPYSFTSFAPPTPTNDSNSSKTHYSGSDPWMQTMFKTSLYLTQLDTENIDHPDYNRFKDNVMNLRDSKVLLGLPKNPTKKDILIAYKKWSLILHPDKLSHFGLKVQEEASELFKILAEARAVEMAIIEKPC